MRGQLLVPCLLFVPILAHAEAPALRVRFGESTRVALGHKPVALDVGYLDQDGAVDVVLANDDSVVSTVLGDGTGGLRTPHERVVAPDLAGVALGDVDADLLPDVAVSASTSGSVFVLRGVGDGTLAGGDTLRAPWTPGALALVRPAGALVSDLVVADLFFQQIVLAKNDGSGRFSIGRQYVGFIDPVAMAARRGDLAVADQSSHFAALLVDFGEPGPEVREQAPVTGRPVAVALGDLDGTGHDDLVAATREPALLNVLLREADGSLRPAHSYGIGSDPRALALADFDGDGGLDVAVADHAANSLEIWLGAGDGSFVHAASVPTGAGPVALAVADMNGDGWPDLVCANHDEGTLQVFLDQTSPPSGAIRLLTPTPNPSAGSSTISVVLSTRASVRMDIHDTTGRLVRRITDDQVIPAGTLRFLWDGRTDAGDLARSGLYFARVRAGSAEATTRIVLER